MTDPLLHLLDRLPSASLDPVRADRIRARCHTALGRQRSRAAVPPRTARRWPQLVAGLGGLYLTGALREVLTMYGLL